VSCMAYVFPELKREPCTCQNGKNTRNLAFCLKGSTSIKTRIEVAKTNSTQPKTLFPFTPFIGKEREDQSEGLPFKLTDYLELIDLTGRVIRSDKRGALDISLAPILQRINLTSGQWLEVRQALKGTLPQPLVQKSYSLSIVSILN